MLFSCEGSYLVLFHHSLQGVDAMVSRLDIQKEAADRSLGGFESLQAGVQQDITATANMLAKGRADQQVL